MWFLFNNQSGFFQRSIVTQLLNLLMTSVTSLGDLLDFGQLFKAFRNN